MKRINETLKRLKGLDKAMMDRAQLRLDHLTKPQGSLGRLESLAKQVVGITGMESPKLARKVIFTLAADHGIVREGVSAYPQEVTAQMVYNFLRKGAGINVLAEHVGAKVIVADLGVAVKIKVDKGLSGNFRDAKIGFGTKNFVKGPAMTRMEATRSIEAGIALLDEAWKKGLDIAGTGDMGIGNTTPSSAITAVITGKPVADVTGRGTGLDDDGLNKKISAIEKGIAINNPIPGDGIDVLAKVGGFEIGGLAGVMLAAASRRVPVVIDGFISGAAALIAYTIDKRSRDYMIASHRSVEKGHRIILEYLGLEPIFDLNLRLGEGTGAALGISIIEASIKILTEMATFDSAAVSQKVEVQREPVKS